MRNKANIACLSLLVLVGIYKGADSEDLMVRTDLMDEVLGYLRGVPPENLIFEDCDMNVFPSKEELKKRLRSVVVALGRPARWPLVRRRVLSRGSVSTLGAG